MARQRALEAIDAPRPRRGRGRGACESPGPAATGRGGGGLHGARNPRPVIGNGCATRRGPVHGRCDLRSSRYRGRDAARDPARNRPDRPREPRSHRFHRGVSAEVSIRISSFTTNNSGGPAGDGIYNGLACLRGGQDAAQDECHPFSGFERKPGRGGWRGRGSGWSRIRDGPDGLGRDRSRNDRFQFRRRGGLQIGIVDRDEKHGGRHRTRGDQEAGETAHGRRRRTDRFGDDSRAACPGKGKSSPGAGTVILFSVIPSRRDRLPDGETGYIRKMKRFLLTVSPPLPPPSWPGPRSISSTRSFRC